MQLEWNDVSQPPRPIAQTLLIKLRQRQEYLADIGRNGWYPASYYTQHCSPWLQSHVLSLSLTSSKAQRSLWFAASLQTVRCTKAVGFPTLAALPFQFIFYNSRRLWPWWDRRAPPLTYVHIQGVVFPPPPPNSDRFWAVRYSECHPKSLN